MAGDIIVLILWVAVVIFFLIAVALAMGERW